jgi:hypothetical protein
MGKIYNFLLILLIFFTIYTPPLPFISFNTLHLVGFFSWIIILLNLRKINYLFDIPKMLTFTGIIFLIFIYLGIVQIFNNESILGEISFLYWIADIIPLSMVIVIYYNSRITNKMTFPNILIIVSSIQGFLSILSFYNQAIHDFFVSTLLNYGYGDILIGLSSHRLFGYGSNLTFTMPLFQTLIALLSFYMGLEKKRFYLIFVPFLLFSSIINARAPILLFFLGMLFIILKTKTKILKFSAYLILIITISYIFIELQEIILTTNRVTTIDWVIEGYNEILDFIIIGRSDGYFFSYFTDIETYRLPIGVALIFGNGTRSLKDFGPGVFSDVGFINDIWLGGFIYTFFLYSMFFLLSFSNTLNFKSKNMKTLRIINYLVVITFLLGNLKGVILSKNEITTTFIFLYVIGVNLRYKKINIDEISFG